MWPNHAAGSGSGVDAVNDAVNDATGERRAGHVGELPGGVLIVEDNDLVREMCAIVLRESGRDILTVNSATEARDLLAGANDIAIVVTDLTMPGEWTGPDLVRHLVDTRPDIGIVVTTGMRDPDLSFAPDAQLVHKPFSVDQLLGAVQRASDVAIAGHGHLAG